MAALMDSFLWKKLAAMARKGDKVVVVEGGEAMVLLPLEAYERLSGGAAEDSTDEDTFELPDLDEPWEADMPSVKAKEPVSVRPSGGLDEFEEERFYLEPVE